MTARQSANNRRNTETGARADQRAAMGATKSAGIDSAATQNNATSPSASTVRPGVPRSAVRKNSVAGTEITRLNSAPAPMARLIGKGEERQHGRAERSAADADGGRQQSDDQRRQMAGQSRRRRAAENQPLAGGHLDGKRRSDAGEQARQQLRGRQDAQGQAQQGACEKRRQPGANQGTVDRPGTPVRHDRRQGRHQDAGLRRADRQHDAVGLAQPHDRKDVEQDRDRHDSAADPQKAGQQADQHAGPQQQGPDRRRVG